MHRSIPEWIKALMPRPPRVFVSDYDPAVDVAVKQVFPECLHVLCIHHFSGNLTKNLAGVLGSEFKDFVSMFWRVYYSLSEELFERNWETMVEKYEMAERYLSRVLYPVRKRWAWFSVSSICTAGVRTSGRIERENRHNKTLGNLKTSLSTLVSRLNDRAAEQEQNKLLEDDRVIDCFFHLLRWFCVLTSLSMQAKRRHQHRDNTELAFANQLAVVSQHCGQFAHQSTYKEMGDSFFYSGHSVQRPEGHDYWVCLSNLVSLVTRLPVSNLGSGGANQFGGCHDVRVFWRGG